MWRFLCLSGRKLKLSFFVFQINHVIPAYKANRRSWNHETFYLKIRAKLAYHRDHEKKAILADKRLRGEAPPAQKRIKKDKAEATPSGAKLFTVAANSSRSAAVKKRGRPKSGGKKTAKTDYVDISDDESGFEATRKRKVTAHAHFFLSKLERSRGLFKEKKYTLLYGKVVAPQLLEPTIYAGFAIKLIFT